MKLYVVFYNWNGWPSLKIIYRRMKDATVYVLEEMIGIVEEGEGHSLQDVKDALDEGWEIREIEVPDFNEKELYIVMDHNKYCRNKEQWSIEDGWNEKVPFLVSDKEVWLSWMKKLGYYTEGVENSSFYRSIYIF